MRDSAGNLTLLSVTDFILRY